MSALFRWSSAGCKVVNAVLGLQDVWREHEIAVGIVKSLRRGHAQRDFIHSFWTGIRGVNVHKVFV